ISPSPPHEITLSWPQRLNRTGAAPSNRRWGKVMGTATTTAVAVGLAAALLASAPTQAQPVSDFYRGKTLRMLIGYGPGGGYDIYGGAFCRFLSRPLPRPPAMGPPN